MSRVLVVCALFVLAESAWPQGRQRSRATEPRAVRQARSDTSDGSRTDARRTGRSRERRAQRISQSGEVVTFDSLTDSSVSSRSRSRAYSLASKRTRAAADRDPHLRIVISLDERRLWALVGSDTVLATTVAVSSDATLAYAGRTWRFETPRGVRTVRAKRENPAWIPPDWHYAEVAREHGLALAPMKPGRTTLPDGNWLEVRDSTVGYVDAASGEFSPLPTEEEIVFDGTLFIPPVGSVNRRIEGELGRHALDTGNGILLHGTPHKESIGTAATHGCIRLDDDAILWLYEVVPVGARVYIY